MREYYVGAFAFSPNDIYHHGVKGQKWGVRRYVNPDGTLTPEGKRRYGTTENFRAAQELQKAKSERRSALGNYLVRNDPIANRGNKLGTAKQISDRYNESKNAVTAAKARYKKTSEKGRRVAMNYKIMNSPVGKLGSFLAGQMAKDIKRRAKAKGFN